MKIKRSIGTLALAALMGTTVLVTSGLAHGAQETETRDLDEFNRVAIKGAMDVVIEVGKSQSVEVSADEDYLDRVETRVDDGTLYISQEGRRWYDIDVDIEITVRNLDGIFIDGAADIDATGIDSDNFDLEINGAGDVTLEGACGTVTIEINGAGDVDAEDLKCKNVDITINGAGDVDASASESVVAELNGVGDITICGDPDKVRPRIRGLGSFKVSDCD
ncbi:MAG: DUF2807 domain-containing protein [Proteobacteria bacterium]|nr:DUF2807 domain-containing protein [Pseudomonadota bacterium]